MSRSGYIDDFDDPLQLGRWRAQVAASIRGKRGQKLLKELVTGLEAMPEKRLIADSLKDQDGEFCALGVVGQCRGLKLEEIDPEDYSQVASRFDIAEPLAREIVAENDEMGMSDETPEHRWHRIHQWAKSLIKSEPIPETH